MQLSARVLLAIVSSFAAFRVSAAQAPPPSFLTLSTQAQTARDAHQLEKAVDLYKKALKLKPAWDEGLWNLGSIEYDLNRYKDCAWAFGKLFELKPDGAPGWTMAGLCEYGFRNYGSALDDFTRAEQLGFSENPELARVGRLDYALVLIKNENFERAITVLTDLTRKDKKATPEIIAAGGIAGLRRPWLPAEVPEEEREMVYRVGDAMASGMQQDYKVANQKFDEVLKAYPSEPDVHFRYGAMLYAQSADRGIEEIKKAIELAPDHVPALVSMSAISLKREDPKTAVEYGELAVKAAPGDFATHIVLGRALLASDDLVRAAAELQQAVKLAPSDPDAHFSLATAYSRLGKKEDAAREQNEFKRLEHLGGK
jgi:tetratricopeptide (TPR) repeat protein